MFITKRAAIRLTLLLLGGAIINVAVAWECAVWVDTNLAEGESESGQGKQAYWWDAVRYSRSGAMMFRVERIGAPDDAREWGNPRLLPAWSEFAKPTDGLASGDHHYEIRYGDARGWPALALWSKVREEYETRLPDSLTAVRHKLPLRWGIATSFHPWKVGYYDSPKTLPLRPIWPGFAINTVFYAAILWLLFIVPRAWRRRRRIRRGLCPKCAYDLRGRAADATVCPECGAAVQT